jgi:catechol 2,3-dioxygenase-like lactoylglutathione lyase family enzyme
MRRNRELKLGNFSISLAVKDMEKSLDFYGKFGFEVIDGGHINEEYADSATEKWRVLQNESATVGLFQGMFLSNILTFNPEDLRPIQASLKEQSVEFDYEADLATFGPCSALLKDPDGNLILLDQRY